MDNTTHTEDGQKTALPDGPPVLNGYMTEVELAAEIGRSPRTLARWRALDEGPRFLRLGREIFYKKSSVAAWLASLEEAA